VLNGCLIPLSNSISNEEGVLIEPLGCCVRAWSKIKAVKNDSCVIFGMGTIGIMHSMLAKYYKFNQIFCVDVNKEKLKICKEMDLGHGINSTIENFDNIKKLTDNQGVDLIIIATSDIGILKQAVELVRKGGKIMLFGQPKKDSFCEIDMSQVYSKEITIYTTYAASNEDIRIAIDLIQNHSINVKNLVTHKFSIKDSKEAFECAIKNNNSIKVMITGT
jgi:L-iditol 2-dehydrogenase